MSARSKVKGVDVLAMIDQDRTRLAKGYGEVMAEHDGYLADHDVMRAAVAELIEAAIEVRGAHRELPGRDHPAEVRQAGESRIGHAHHALDAALARVEGHSHG